MTKFYIENKEEVNKRYRFFKSLVNMSYEEMKKWAKDPCSKAASIKVKEVVSRVTRLLKKPKETWTIRDYIDSGKVTAYLSRAIKIKDSIKPASKTCPKGKNYYALKNWAYDRSKQRKKK